MSKPLSQTDYPLLLKQIRQEMILARQKIQNTQAAAYWNIGRYISLHILKNKARAGYDQQVFKRLAEDLKVSKRLLHHTLDFYRTFPNVTARSQLGWTHYKRLLRVEDVPTRTRLCIKAVKENLTTRELAAEIQKCKAVELSKRAALKPLTAQQGSLHIYQARPGEAGYIYIDLGFSITRQIKSRARIGEGGLVQSSRKNNGYAVKGVEGSMGRGVKSPLYTYKAYLERVIDGDTLKLNIDLGFDTFIKETVRLRGINAPEIKSKMGMRSKRVLTRILKQPGEIIVKTHWEDKFGRYLVDVWMNEEYMNQRLVMEGLAETYG